MTEWTEIVDIIKQCAAVPNDYVDPLAALPEHALYNECT